MVTFEIGVTKQRHVVHKKLLIKESPYFRAMFEGAWKESTSTKPIAFPEVPEKVFAEFVSWLYFRRPLEWNLTWKHWEECFQCVGKCEGPLTHQTDNPVEDLEDLTPEQDADVEKIIETAMARPGLIRMYIFADQFDVPTFREDIINTAWHRWHKKPTIISYRGIITSYRYLPSSSPMRRLLNDICLQAWPSVRHPSCPFARMIKLKVPSSFWAKILSRNPRSLGSVHYASITSMHKTKLQVAPTGCHKTPGCGALRSQNGRAWRRHGSAKEPSARQKIQIPTRTSEFCRT